MIPVYADVAVWPMIALPLAAIAVLIGLICGVVSLTAWLVRISSKPKKERRKKR